VTSSPPSRPISPRTFRRAVETWAKTVDRPLPWRGERDPYRVLVSEVMLQQTQASRVAPAYESFLVRFPSVDALARADLADVLREWGTLGYNRRAANLWRCARAIVARGEFPSTVDELTQLPGIGPYTARAVASFAFGQDAGVVDANVRRALSRVYGAGESVQDIADALVPSGRSASWNQTMIDLGALVCRARNPSCDVCPLRRWCAWTEDERTQRGPSVTFHTTSRYARGRVVAVLRDAPHPLGVSELGRRTGVGSERFAAALASLEHDGIVHRTGRSVALGSPAT
jgi:A/G-specific adenine glycosylase